jgi:NTE family protein
LQCVQSGGNQSGGNRVANLAMGGGGVRGIGLVGAVEVLAGAGYTFSRVVGTSAGALVAAFVASLTQRGEPISTLAGLLDRLDYSRLADPAPIGRLPIVGQSFEIGSGRTLYQGRYLRDFVNAQLAELGVRTFADLALPQGEETSHLAASQRYRLAVTVTDLTLRREAVLPWDLPEYGVEPDGFPVADAVLASSAIPFVFPPVGLPTSGGTSALVDGGVLDDVPVTPLDSSSPQPPPVPNLVLSLGGLVPPSAHRAGLLGGRLPSLGGPGKVVDEVVDLVETLLAGGESRTLADPCTRERTIRIDASGVSALQFDISAAQRKQLVDKGRAAATEFLQGWDFNHWLERCGSYV